MAEFKLSDSVIETAFRTLVLSECDTDDEVREFTILCEICDKHRISVKAFMAVSGEFEERLKELQTND